jgi:hypothetical protein
MPERDFIRRPLTADELRWTLEPLPRLAHVDLLMFNESELLAYTRGLQEECARLKELTHAAVSQLSSLSEKVARCSALVYELRAENANLRANRQS